MATRLFAAIYPPEQALDEAAHLLDQVRAETGIGLRWMPLRQWHITCAFYGQSSAGTAADIDQALARIGNGYPSFALSLQGAGHFGHRTLWLGVGGAGEDQLARLSAEARQAGEAAGLEMGPERAFTPHLTVARRSVRGRFRDRQAERGHRRQVRQARKHGFAEDIPPPILGTDEMDFAVRALSIFRGRTFVAEELVLVESTLGDGPGGGAHHQPLASYPLRGAA
ncbi:RNA 2',3'-cyclic phosphodiesterase [Micrococcoides hystricis]|uniref:RNA 2',3'-cyclic phosphodiesterase n=1 Tax=Micrococcoides hystricis TaxID=1572761 RepID=A0ABV6PBZ3_9MICC